MTGISESRQYQWLRLGSGLAIVALFGVLFGLSARSWPIVHQVFWPAKIGCGCGAVTISVPPIGAVTAGLVMIATLVIIGRFLYFFWRAINRSRRALRSWTAAGQRSIWQQAIGEKIIIVTRPGRQAMTMGLLQPRIYITADLIRSLCGSELTAVLRHEQAHRRRYDQLCSTILESFSLAWWRLPMLQALVAANVTLRELAADSEATNNYVHSDGLSGAIIKLASRSSVQDVVGFSPNQDRVEKLLNTNWRPQLQLWRWSYGFGLGLLAFGIGLIVRLTPPAMAEASPVVVRTCQETRLLCLWQPQGSIPFSQEKVEWRIRPPLIRILPQSVYVLPDSSN